MPKITQTGLLRRPHWNIRRIRMFYPVPDCWEPNPKDKMYRWMKLYSVEKIQQIENSPEFQADVERYRNRRRKRMSMEVINQ